jgi:integrase
MLPLARLPGTPGEAEFHAKYASLLAQVERVGNAGEAGHGTFNWLVKQYEGSVEFKQLADPTQRDYSTTLRVIEDKLGDQLYRFTTRAMVKAVRDDFASTPRKAHKIKQTVSRLYSWAAENSLVPDNMNPAQGIKTLKPKGGVQEYVAWSDAEIDLFCQSCPPHVLTPVLIALYTGQRREDVVRMTWQQFQGDVVRVRQSKTTALLDIACHSVLRRHLERLRPHAQGVVICTTSYGKAFTANGLSKALWSAVLAVKGMANNRSMHGLRYSAGARMEEAGCTVAEIEAVLGHRTFKMALKYASQRMRSRSAIDKLEGKGGK